MMNLMERMTTKTIDELGRIVLPATLRQDGWCVGSTVSMYHADRNTVIIQLTGRHDGPVCCSCKQKEQITIIRGIEICSLCVAKIKEA